MGPEQKVTVAVAGARTPRTGLRALLLGYLPLAPPMCWRGWQPTWSRTLWCELGVGGSGDTHERARAQPPVHPFSRPAGSSGPLDREKLGDVVLNSTSLSQQPKQGLGFPGEVVGTLPVGGCSQVAYCSGLRDKLRFCGPRTARHRKVKAQMPCQPAPGENIWGARSSAVSDWRCAGRCHVRHSRYCSQSVGESLERSACVWRVPVGMLKV